MNRDNTAPYWPQNLSSGFPTKRDSGQSLQLNRLARKIEMSLVSSLDVILSKKRITKAMIGLRRLVCVFVVCKPPEDRVSRVETQLWNYLLDCIDS